MSRKTSDARAFALWTSRALVSDLYFWCFFAGDCCKLSTPSWCYLLLSPGIVSSVTLNSIQFGEWPCKFKTRPVRCAQRDAAETVLSAFDYYPWLYVHNLLRFGAQYRASQALGWHPVRVMYMMLREHRVNLLREEILILSLDVFRRDICVRGHPFILESPPASCQDSAEPPYIAILIVR